MPPAPKGRGIITDLRLQQHLPGANEISWRNENWWAYFVYAGPKTAESCDAVNVHLAAVRLSTDNVGSGRK